MITLITKEDFYELMVELLKINQNISQMEKQIMSALTDLQAQVAETLTVEQSAITLINGFKTQVAAAVAAAQAGDMAPLTALNQELVTSGNALAAAVTANTAAATPVADPAATPVATPVTDPATTPVATPVADPAATPVADPAATPVADPAVPAA